MVKTISDDELFATAEYLALAAVDYPELVPLYQLFLKRARRREGAPGMKGRTTMTQVEKILRHLRENGSITQREAYIDYGIQSFHRRLTDLKDMGYELEGEGKTHPVTKQEYTRYRMVSS